MSTAGMRMLRAYLVSRALAPPDADARATLVFDGRHRVRLQEGVDGRVVVCARLVDLPACGAGRDALLIHVARHAARMITALRQPAPSCVVDAREEAVWLQLRLAPDGADTGFATAVDGFVGWLAFWERVVERMPS